VIDGGVTELHVMLPVAASAADYFWSITIFLWASGIQLLICAAIGFAVAHKTNRSTFNWIVTGVINGVLIPLAGIPLMVFAYFVYPPAPPEYVSRRILGARRKAPRSERDEAIRRDERRRRGMKSGRK
jgi:hypothetical protein